MTSLSASRSFKLDCSGRFGSVRFGSVSCCWDRDVKYAAPMCSLTAALCKARANNLFPYFILMRQIIVLDVNILNIFLTHK
jgi:hypothetical protein